MAFVNCQTKLKYYINLVDVSAGEAQAQRRGSATSPAATAALTTTASPSPIHVCEK